MQEFREFVTFSANFASDELWNDAGDLLVPGGKAVAESIQIALERAACHCSPVSKHSSYGWTFDVHFQGETIRLVVAAAEGHRWLLQIESKCSLFRRLFVDSRSAQMKAFQIQLHDVLTSDERLSHVLWHTRRDYENNQDEKATSNP
jgi:hypothetical protein